jgi:hypothetical protein
MNAQPIPTLIKPAEAFARMSAEQAKELDAYTLGVQAVTWGMQWVKASEAFRKFTHPLPPGQARLPVDSQPHGVNIWGHASALLTDEIRLIETPNTETLYSIADVDLNEGPVVVVHPDHGDRYFRTTIWEIHSDTHTISQKQDGGHPPPYALIRLGWRGELPDGMKSVTIRGRYAHLAPHIAVYGDDDLPNVHALQKGYKLVALKDWVEGKKSELKEGPPMRPLRRPGTKTPPELFFFEELCETLKDIEIRADEVGFARQLQRIGVTLNDGFQVEKLEEPAIKGLKRALLDAQSLLEHNSRTQMGLQPGGTWGMSYDTTGLDDWLFRGSIGWKYIWGDLVTEMLYPMARSDEQGTPLDGKNNYRLHFPPGELPPARYWRISMYDLEGFFIHNPINRFGIGNMAEKLTPDVDGGLTIYIQHASPGKDKEINWLPSPDEGFFIVLRMYQPEERMYRGDYIVPPVIKVNS